MWAMCFASLGWAAWWLALLGSRAVPSAAGWLVLAASAASGLFGLPGLAIAALTVRARRTWLLFVAVPLFANASLLAMPWLARGGEG